METPDGLVGVYYEDLVAARKRCRLCMRANEVMLRNGADYAFDPPVVSHWSQWLGSKQPLVLVIGQDFGNVEYFEKHFGHDHPDSKTNKNLRTLLGCAGLTVAPPPEPDSTAQVYLANAILCMKAGSMTEGIRARWVDTCTRTHLLSLAKYLNAPFVVGMGSAGWRAARTIFHLTNAPVQISMAAGNNWNASGTQVFAVGHCGPLGLRNRRWSQQLADWERIGDALRERMNVSQM